MGHSSDDENLAPVLPVSDETDFDPAVPPKTGAEYLARVQVEAKQYPNVVTAKPKPSKRKSKQKKSKTDCSQYEFEALKNESFIKAAPEICETQSWVAETIDSFIRVRDKVAVARTSDKSALWKQDNVKVPHFGDLHQWKRIILGELEECADTSSEPPTALICKSNGGKGPLLSLVLQFPQAAVIDFLESLTSWIREFGWCHQIAVWTYSMLVCLEIPLHSDTVSVVRELSRACSLIRSRHVEIEDKFLVTSLNLVICLIAKFFGQLDISDDYIQEPQTSSISQVEETKN